MTASTNEIRPGMKVEVDNEPWLIVNNEFVKPGKGQAFNRIKMKNMITGRMVERTYKSGEKLDLADIAEQQMRYLYQDGENAVFMDEKTFDQIEVGPDILKPVKHWLVEEVIYQIVIYKGAVVEVVPPTFLDMVVTETTPGVRGDTSGRVMKAATTSTGAKIQIPIFIDEGEKIRVDTRTGEYAARAND